MAAYPNRIINIHHSFLPAFAGARPYRQAYERGVKVIGATAHYVTSSSTRGRSSSRTSCGSATATRSRTCVGKGRDLEKVVLARAVALHLNDRVLVYGNKTVVFD